jgi:hypothetical protein
MSMTRLWRDQGKRVEAFGEPIIDRSEKIAGLVPLDLKEAKALLEELAS